MGSRLVNVRLDEERLRKAKRLRESGIALSDLVREAIDARFDGLRTGVKRPGADAVMTSILERHPDPPDMPPRTYDVHDGRAARAAIRRRRAPRRGRR
jgi:hypothetical protein